MNITESALIAAIILAISGAVLYVGGKAFDQVEAHSTYMEQIASSKLDAPVMEQMAQAEAERRQRLADEHGATR